MATYTVDERGRDGEADRPYTFGGTLEVVHTRDGGARPEHVLVYRRDDGRRVVEFRTGGRRWGRTDDGYAVVAPEDLRRVIVEGCAGPQARAVARQLGLAVDEGRRRWVRRGRAGWCARVTAAAAGR